MKSNKIIVALDSNNLKKIEKIVRSLKSEVYAFKIGYEFFFNFGIEGYLKIKKICPKIFLDLKLHDIPNTVHQGLKALVKLKPMLTTIHISGGDQMMKSSLIKNRVTKILGVSVLTSLDQSQTKKYYNEEKIESLVKKFVKQAIKQKLDGIVCSPKELIYLRNILPKNFIIVTPGIRINSYKNKNDDQRRVLTPKEAVEKGASLLVIGRPITLSKDPLKTIKKINNSLK